MADAQQELKVRIDLTDESAAKLAIACAPLIIKRLVDDWSPFGFPSNAMPAIGTRWIGQGGTYAGNVRGDVGHSDYALVVADPSFDAGTWDAAMAWAKTISTDDCNGFELPKRKEQAIMFGNVPELFQKEWYWSAEHSASNPDSAWYQLFGNGLQYYGH